MNILGIETSCDETSAAVVSNGTTTLSNLILSQTEIHEYFGGVVPELASRRHIEVIRQLTADALTQSCLLWSDINAIAVTQGPGLVGALLVGLSFSKALSYSLNVPLIAVNHVEGHLYASFLEHDHIELPALGLVVSGGHTMLVYIKSIGDYKVCGTTLDDAAGEAFDKVAKLLDLGYPGGPLIDTISKKGNSKAVRFPQTAKTKNEYDFSFSGLKTAVVYHVKGFTQYSEKTAANTSVQDIVASFQEAVVYQILERIERMLLKYKVKSIICGGGVIRNTRLRACLHDCAQEKNLSVYIPSPILCTDNAAMIAGLGFYTLMTKGAASMNIDAQPRLVL